MTKIWCQFRTSDLWPNVVFGECNLKGFKTILKIIDGCDWRLRISGLPYHKSFYVAAKLLRQYNLFDRTIVENANGKLGLGIYKKKLPKSERLSLEDWKTHTDETDDY
jgi:hypothetical protein